MTYEELLKLVKRMREAQKKFFKTRNYDDLAEAKKAEKEIDKLIEEEETGPSLF